MSNFGNLSTIINVPSDNGKERGWGFPVPTKFTVKFESKTSVSLFKENPSAPWNAHWKDRNDRIGKSKLVGVNINSEDGSICIGECKIK